MRRPVLSCLAVLLIAAGCEEEYRAARDAVPPPVNVIDASNLNELMLTIADAEQAVEYFRGALALEPNRVDLQRGYARSLSRAGKHAEASLVYRQIIAGDQATPDDRLGFAEALAQNNAWDEVRAQLAEIPGNASSYRLNLLRAMEADQRADWEAADRYYGATRGLTTQPARILNNWGVSRMSRGDLKAAETTLLEAVSFDPKMFAAKNNLVIVRGLQDKFTLPVIPMNEEEKAQLLHNLAIIALRKGKTEVGRGLLLEAVETHPRHFDAAVAKLEALKVPLKR